MERLQIIDTLNDLIEVCKDGEYGFDTCADHAVSAEARERFRARARDCRRAAQDLQNLVLDHGGAPDQSGSALGAMQRGWVVMLGAVAGHSDRRLLEAAERGEDSALARYREALADDRLPPAVRAVVERQMADVRQNHDQIRLLRARARIDA